MKSIHSIVGTRYHHGAPEMVKKLKAGESLVLAREPENPHDSFAILVSARGMTLGHIKADEEQRRFAKEMDARNVARISGKYVPSEWPSVEVDIEHPDLL